MKSNINSPADKRRERIRKYKKAYSKRRVFWNLTDGCNYRYEDKLTPLDLWKIAHRQRLICPLTGEKLSRENISIDHILPRSQGGRNVPENVRLTTKDINWFKRTMSDTELLTMCQKVVAHQRIK